MQLTPSFSQFSLSRSTRRFTGRLRRLLSRKLLCFALIFNLLIFPSPVAMHQLSTTATAAFIDSNARVITAAVRVASFLFKPFLGSRATAQRRETTADRTSSVNRISVTPAKFVGYVGDELSLTALGSNAAGLTIQGAQFNWSSSDSKKLHIDSSGLATLNEPGLIWVTAATGNVSTRVPVLIQSGERPMQSDS
jgi:hypothetical protein